MIEFIIILKAIIPCIVWWININYFYLASKLFFETMKSKEIVAFYDEIIFDNSIFTSVEILK